VNDGYSILVFPEGRRTRDGKISRFHNGAVYLSEKLKLDILPIVIHGANHCMDRNEFFIRNGQVTLKFFDPIKKENFFNKETYIARSNELLYFFRNEFNKLSVELETPDYFSPVLIQSYIYKGPVLEWYLRIKIRLENNYKFFNSIIPRDAVICDIGCGYGFMAAMLKMVAPERRIFAIDYDAQKVELAKHAHKNKEGLVFISGDILNIEIPKSDTIILADVLHYMPEKQRESCIQKCMDSLNINGQIIIRDADTDLTKRTKGTKLTEFFSTRLLGFNKTEYDKLYFFSGKKIEQLALSNGFSVNRIDKTKLTSNVIYILQRKVKI
jgi:2-polyprenyl-3-methyl-5-hydroxy-6-metoxy-1,4-benzoquinol methylase